VTSPQRDPHRNLESVVKKHLRSSHQSTIAPFDLDAFARLLDYVRQHPRPLILDSFCGTGQSTALLAERHRQHLVIGIDKSAARLNKHVPNSSADNYILLQANCEAIWQQLVEVEFTLASHYLLYPNPWPKSKHLKRRIHGHPSFSHLLKLAGAIEVRSNWPIYLQEFDIAMKIAGHHGSLQPLETQDTDLTLFERKYRLSDQTLWSYRCELDRDERCVIR